jgi:hypothetical protein
MKKGEERSKMENLLTYLLRLKITGTAARKPTAITTVDRSNPGAELPPKEPGT